MHLWTILTVFKQSPLVKVISIMLNSFIAFASFTTTVSAWGMNGHMFAANMAQNILLENAPSTMDKALTTL
jgi:hypothetical protein